MAQKIAREVPNEIYTKFFFFNALAKTRPCWIFVRIHKSINFCGKKRQARCRMRKEVVSE